MTTDDLSFMSAHDRKMHSRLAFDGERYPNCREVKICIKESCHGCRTCPRCGGTLWLDVQSESISQRTCTTYIQEQFICVHCGAWTERYRIQTTKKPGAAPDSDAPFCAVLGCQHRAWGKLTITVDDQEHPACVSHRRMHQRWVRMGSSKSTRHLAATASGHLEVIERTKS
jgi:hypothetical protein